MGPQKAMRPVSLRASLRLDVRRAAPSSAAVIIVEARDPFTQGELQGGAPVLTDPRVDAKKTQPPPRYNEGTLVGGELAKEKSVGLPAGYARDFEICRRFLDHHARH